MPCGWLGRCRKGCELRRPPEAKKGRKQILPWSLQEVHSPTGLFSTSGLQKQKIINVCRFKPLTL